MFSLLLILFAGCSQAGIGKEGTVPDLLAEPPVTVEIKKGTVDELESYSAEVVLYKGNDRDTAGIVEDHRYRLSVKEMDGNVYTRIDYPAASSRDGVARSTLNTGDELFIFKTQSNELEHRLPVDTLNDPGPGFEVGGRLGLRAYIEDFPALRTRLHSLALDIEDDEANQIFKAVLPSDDVDRFSLKFDAAKEVLIGAEIVQTVEDGTVISSELDYVYKEVNGELLKVGEIYENHYDVPGVIDSSEYKLPIYETVEDIPEISEEELQALIEDGAELYDMPITIGDPSDPDYTETTVMLYEKLELNEVDDAYMRKMW